MPDAQQCYQMMGLILNLKWIKDNTMTIDIPFLSISDYPLNLQNFTGKTLAEPK